MEKELFIKSINAIQQQVQYDISVSEHLGKALPDNFQANLLPKNHLLQNALVECLQVAMNDTLLCPEGQSWIEYFCWELDFGQENYRMKVRDKDGKDIPLSTAGELWEYLQSVRQSTTPLLAEINRCRTESEIKKKDWGDGMSEHAIEARAMIMLCDHLIGYAGKPILPAVEWQEIGADDFAATSICKKYYFRAEQMDKKLWWWSVDCLSELIGDSWQSDVVAQNKRQAFSLAEKCYHAHLGPKQ